MVKGEKNYISFKYLLNSKIVAHQLKLFDCIQKKNLFKMIKGNKPKVPAGAGPKTRERKEEKKSSLTRLKNGALNLHFKV